VFLKGGWEDLGADNRLVGNPQEGDERSREMSEQERERSKAEVEAHRSKAATEEPKDDMDRVRETDEGDEVEAHRAKARAKQ
jgi:hypothetical protein